MGKKLSAVIASMDKQRKDYLRETLKGLLKPAKQGSHDDQDTKLLSGSLGILKTKELKLNQKTPLIFADHFETKT